MEESHRTDHGWQSARGATAAGRVCGEHIAWGYVDHPPLIAWIARLVREALGESLVALRLVPALAGAATLLLTAMLCRALGGGRLAQVLACLCVLVAPYFLAVGHLLTMNALEPALWTAAMLVLVLIVSRQAWPRAWLVLGALFGVGLLNKHSTLFLGFAATVGLLTTPERRALMTRWPWHAVLVALLLFAPNLAWQAGHDWPTLEFMHNARALKMAPTSCVPPASANPRDGANARSRRLEARPAPPLGPHRRPASPCGARVLPGYVELEGGGCRAPGVPEGGPSRQRNARSVPVTRIARNTSKPPRKSSHAARPRGKLPRRRRRRRRNRSGVER